MTSGEKPVTVSEKTSFSAVVDNACDRLLDRQAQYSIRRIQEMESRLAGLEQELDELLIHNNRK
ncbi:MAG: hypothetical protein LBD48_02435 [Treponema sp.]|jgi:hypothetical protein|nr:hypothetical protein [Treponema sp.]